MSKSPTMLPSRTSRRIGVAIRRGISVLEVLIAIGVATIGLLGVIALIPYAAHQAKKATIQDRTAQLGRNAFREFRIRHMSDPTTWRGAVLFPTSSTTFGNVSRTNFVNTTFRDSFGAFFGDTSDEYLRAFCIDPRFVAATSTFGAPVTRNLAAAAYAFPYTLDSSMTRPAPLNDKPLADANIVRMQRISLAAADFSGSVMPSIMSVGQADAIFLSPDDVRFARPGNDAPTATLSLEDATLPPVQLNDDGDLWDPTDATHLARSSDGDYSWMATLVPTAEAGPGQAMYTLTVVVFYKRDGTRNFENERVVDILHGQTSAGVNYTTFFGGGISGGDVGLVCRRSFTAAPTYLAKDVAVERGYWVLLSRLSAFDTASSPNVPRPALHQWYQVIAADGEIATANSTTIPGYDLGPRPMRYVTLQGPDWPYVRSNSTFSTQVTIVENVVAVFEKTIRLETSSLWRN